jgi:archaellum component FlaC
MAVKKKTKRTSKPARTDVPHWVGVFQEHVSSEMKAFAEGMDARLDRLALRMDQRFESIERQLGLLTDAVRTHSKELQRMETTLEEHESRISKFEGAAE